MGLGSLLLHSYRIQKLGAWSRFSDRVSWVLAFVLPLAVYAKTLAPTVYGLDSAEFTISAYTLGISHPTGYPTYLLLGRLFLFLPIGDIAYRLNLASAFFGACTIGLAYRIALRLTRERTPAWVAALSLAFSYFFWTDAVVAEVYTLQTCCLAALILVLLQWRDTHDRRWLYRFAFLYGLSLGDHMTALFWVPGFLYFILHEDWRGVLRSRAWLIAFGVFLVGVSVYLYLPLRSAAGAHSVVGHYLTSGQFVPMNLTTWEGFWWMISGQAFHSLAFAYPPDKVMSEAARFAGWLWGNFLSIGAALGLLGGLVMARRARRDFIFILLLMLPHVVFLVNYAVGDKQTMFLPVYMLWSLWLAWGYSELLQLGRSLRNVHVYLWMNRILILVPLLMLVVNYMYADVSQDWRARTWSEGLLRSVEPNALIVGSWTAIQPLEYLQIIEGQRPDVTLVNRALIAPSDLSQLVAGRSAHQPIYSLDLDQRSTETNEHPSVANGYKLVRKP